MFYFIEFLKWLFPPMSSFVTCFKMFQLVWHPSVAVDSVDSTCRFSRISVLYQGKSRKKLDSCSFHELSSCFSPTFLFLLWTNRIYFFPSNKVGECWKDFRANETKIFDFRSIVLARSSGKRMENCGEKRIWRWIDVII